MNNTATALFTILAASISSVYSYSSSGRMTSLAPMIQGPSPNETIILRQIAAAPVVVPYIDTASFRVPVGGLGRTHWKLAAAELLQLPPLPDPEKSIIITEGEAGFDLWDAVQALKLSPGSDVLLSFTISVHQARTVVLGLGCDDTAIISHQHRIQFATMGVREFVRSENLVLLDLEAGDNNIVILCRKPVKWLTIPQQHDRLEWQLSIDVFGSPELAWEAFRHRNFHLTDTAVFDSFDDVRIEASLPGHETVSLYDLTGCHIVDGKVDRSGHVAWQLGMPRLPFLGFMFVGEKDAEAVIATGKHELEALCTSWMEKRRSVDGVDPWIKRAIHLLDPNSRAQHDYWWARKLALSMVMSLTFQGASMPESVFSCYLPGRMKFGSYISAIDATHQYFRLFTPLERSGQPLRLLVILPSVGSNVRPFLESVAIASLRESEDVSDLAEAKRLAILWPGIVDADYGGDSTRKQLDECVAAVRSLFPEQQLQIYLIGSCSSGVAALGYAETRTVAGIALQTPVIARRDFRWLHGLEVDDVPYPSVVLAREQTTTRLEDLTKTPILLVYNKELPGHGDRAGSQWLCRQLKALGGDIEQRWPPPADDVLWGESARMQLEPILKWIVQDRTTVEERRPRVGSLSTEGKVCTVKDALLEGFAVSIPSDRPLNEWFTKWRHLWSTIRGETWQNVSGGLGTHTLVTGKVLADGDLKELAAGRFCLGTFWATVASPFEVTNDDQLWGFRLLPMKNSATVEVFRSRNAVAEFPKLELAVDGCCRGALWKKVFGSWVLVGIWE